MTEGRVIKHIDLFSGIGGFSLACDWLGIETICFCEMDKFCQKVLEKHWPGVPIVEDVNNVEEIKRIVANSELFGCIHRQTEIKPTEGRQQTLGNIGAGIESSGVSTADSANLGHERNRRTRNGREGLENSITPNATIQGLAGCGSQRKGTRQGQRIRIADSDSLLLTAGFPCQPFSNAGRKRGADDHRYLWPQTLAVIESIKPDYVLLENVAGILNMVFPDSESGVASQASFLGDPNDEIADYRTICGGIERDLRQAGYETVWLVIPACSLGAPHRRDRVWIVAYSLDSNNRMWGGQIRESHEVQGIGWKALRSRQLSGASDVASHASESGLQGKQQSSCDKKGTKSRNEQSTGLSGTIPGWQEDWYEVATKFCRVSHGIPDRVHRLKALGNAIVPQIAYEIIKAITVK